ncbi:hypothetical protein J6590_010887 [Homalodisca vitripennis]|nr:hypothetical protein J6590_010887 [Homalodisca vitripennis]
MDSLQALSVWTVNCSHRTIPKLLYILCLLTSKMQPRRNKAKLLDFCPRSFGQVFGGEEALWGRGKRHLLTRSGPWPPTPPDDRMYIYYIRRHKHVVPQAPCSTCGVTLGLDSSLHGHSLGITTTPGRVVNGTLPDNRKYSTGSKMLLFRLLQDLHI